MTKLANLAAAFCAMALVISASSAQAAAASKARPKSGLRIGWTNNFLTISGRDIPGGPIETLWWEAFCRKGSTRRDWRETTISHRTELVSADSDGRRLRLKSFVEPWVEVRQELRAGRDEVEIVCDFINRGSNVVDLEWFEPCVRVNKLTGMKQADYPQRCFIFTSQGLKFLHELPKFEEARYRGGQVYVPPAIRAEDVNPRPLSFIQPANGLMGAVSADNRTILALAWDQTQHLFQGVAVCIHADPHLGGLQPGERKRVRGKFYVVPNNPAALLKRYQKDFPKGSW